MKRFLSILLCSAMLVVSVPGMYYAQGFEGQSSYDESAQIKEIDYQLNGGYYVSGYEAPAEYPVAELPGKDDIVNQGYEFGGWYDNENFTGEPLTSIVDDQYEGVVVLYARWIERYYYIDIPASVDADKDDLVISGHAGGLYEKDKVSVSVYSNNEWNLMNGDIRLGYELYNDDTKMSLVNNSVIAELTATGRDNTRKYMTRLLEVPRYAGTYTDNLTFDITFETTRYNIKYETNGGTLYSGEKDDQNREIELKQSVYEAGTKLSDLPVPGKAGATFLGWCYDSACTNYVKRSDRLLSDVVLYASWVDEQELKTVSIDTYARSYDVDAKGFTITVTDKTGKLTKEDVKNNLTIKNVSDSSDEPSIDVVTGNVLDDGAYTFIIKCNGSWQEGCGYRLELSDDRLFFTGYDSTIREYDFTVYKPDVKNVNLGNDIKYISSGSLSNLFVNGERTDKISVTVMTVGSDGTVSQEATKTTGNFTYSDSSLFVGDKIAVYDGDVVPQMDGNVISDEDVSFFEITSVNGNEYSYRGMAAEEILFVPDVLPVNVADDKDNDPDNDSITVSQSKMTYGADSPYAGLGLDEDTTVDAGDYLALYESGDNQVQYAIITNVSADNADYIIAYRKVTWDEVQAAMDVYQTDNVKGESILQNQDVRGIEQSVEQQAVDSGFAQSVVDEVAQAVVRTDSYQELQDYLSQTMNADISIVSVDGLYTADSGNSEIAIYGSKKPTIKLDHVRAELSTGLKHFDNVSGLRLALDIGVEISFSNMKVIVSATFEQEVKININVSGKAIWKVWGIFPYIDDYRVAVSLDLYDYTGINFNVNVRTAEDDDAESSSKLDEAINGIAEELKSMMELGTTYISDNSDMSTRLEELGDAGENKEISVAKSLAERYSDMLDDEADWVDLYTKSLTESHVRVIGIIDIEFKIEFVVSANVNISMGMTYWYKNAKRYVYSIMVFDRKVTSDTIDLCEEQYEFSVYAIGTIGIRAGIRLSVSIGLISTKLASVGFTAEVGGYAQVWGYLYYQLKYTASQGRTSSSMGAIYMEIGMYMEVKFLAQALAGTFSYNPTLFEKQWPLYSVGVVENVCDFSYDQDSVKDVKMKRDVKTVRLPDTYFEMQYLDMKEGLDENDEYFRKIYDDSDRYYVITMTNPAFSYDPATNIIAVDPGSEPQQDGEMIITWKNQKGSFNTRPITRKISLHWDNLRDGYYIAFQTNGGSVVDAIVAKYGRQITKPADPVKQGYTFAGWYTDEALTKKYNVPDVMPNEDRIVYAKWEAADTTYNVVDYVEGTDGVYSVWSTRQETAKTDEKVSPKPDVRSGFATPAVLSQIVNADGSTTINYYYARNKYNIKFVSEGEIVSEGQYTYGTLMPTPNVYRPGYEFVGWEPAVTQTVPAKDTTYTAVWKESDDVVYTTKYYLEDANGGYELDKAKISKGTTGQTVTADREWYDNSLYHLSEELPSGVVTADGSLTFKVRYDRNTFNIEFNPMGGTVNRENITARWGAGVITPVPVRAGYAFVGWYTDKECTDEFDGVMPADNITLYAKWEAGKVNYTVEHLIEKLDGNGYELYDRNVYTADTDSEVTPEVKYMEGFTSPEVQTAIVNGEGTTVVRYFYRRNVHRMVLVLDNGQDDIVYDYMYGTKIDVINPERTGYTFTGWNEDIVSEMPDRDITYVATWSINQYTISFNTDGGNDIAPVTQDYNTKLDISEIPVKKGYTFTGWDNDIPEYMPAGNMVLTAQWSKDVYNITYNLDGGTADNPDTYEVDSPVITLERPKRTGYTFLGWSGTGIDGTQMNPVITTGSTGDREFTANWKENSYTIQFIPYGDGTTGSMEDMNLKYTDRVSISANKFKRTGYTFAGWSLKAGADKAYGDSEVISGLAAGDNERITLYPVWTANNYTVHFDTKNGDAIADRTFTYDKKYQLPTATRYGYTFLGWCVEDGGTVTYVPGASADNLIGEGTVTLYASWSLNRTFTYNHPYSYRVTDNSKEEPVKLHFFIDGASGTSTSGYTRTNSIFMDGISLNEVKKYCSTMTITISYNIKMVDDGYADVDTTYRKNSNKAWTSWREEDVDLKKNNNKTMTHTYTISLNDIDAVCYRFDAHGTGSDKYDLSNIRVSVRFN